MVEKPFGHDLQSARASSTSWSTTCSPPQDVFRIDHYLGKETVQNLLALRFANTLFEPVWNGNFVDSVQITMAEDVGIGGRAGFYDATGAARDVLQNHLLQLLALTAMEEPVEFDAEAIRTEKLKVLARDHAAGRPRRPTPSAASTTRAGSAGERAVGYLDEEDVPTDSTTETYAAVRLGVETRRWAGVPFYLRTGKRLPRRVTEIAVVVQEGAAPAVRRDRHRGARATTSWSSGCSRTRASRCKFGSKVPGIGDGGPRRRRWTSCTARRSPSPPPRPTSG